MARLQGESAERQVTGWSKGEISRHRPPPRQAETRLLLPGLPSPGAGQLPHARISEALHTYTDKCGRRRLF